MRLASFCYYLKRSGRLTDPNQCILCDIASMLAERYDEYGQFLKSRELIDFWLSYEHFEDYKALMDKRNGTPTEGAVVMTAENYEQVRFGNA